MPQGATIVKPEDLTLCPACFLPRETATERPNGVEGVDRDNKPTATPPVVEACLCGYVYGRAAA